MKWFCMCVVVVVSKNVGACVCVVCVVLSLFNVMRLHHVYYCSVIVSAWCACMCGVCV